VAITENRIFQLALSRLSLTGLKRLANRHGRSIDSIATKSDAIQSVCSRFGPKDKHKAMKERLLAGRTSVSIFEFQNGINPSVKVNFNGATSSPSICYLGKKDDLHRGLIHIAWAILAGHANYIDSELDFKSDDEAVIIHSFYEPSKHALQVRANSNLAKKVKKEWARMNDQDPRTGLRDFGLSSINQVEQFAKKIGASLIKCQGEKFEGHGFKEVSGKKDPAIDDLADTRDYENFKETAFAKGVDIEIKEPPNAGLRVSFGLQSRTVVFKTTATEVSIRFVLRELRRYLDSDEHE